MGDYFKPWRRQIGLRTLVLACVFMIGWMRSLSTTDQTPAVELFDRPHFFGSQGGTFYWVPLTKYQTPSSPTTLPVAFDSSSLFRKLGFLEIEIQQNSNGMTLASGKGIGIPYWVVTIPLAILSCLLLLSKPRPLEPMTPVALSPETIV